MQRVCVFIQDVFCAPDFRVPFSFPPVSIFLFLSFSCSPSCSDFHFHFSSPCSLAVLGVLFWSHTQVSQQPLNSSFLCLYMHIRTFAYVCYRLLSAPALSRVYRLFPFLSLTHVHVHAASAVPQPSPVDVDKKESSKIIVIKLYKRLLIRCSNKIWGLGSTRQHKESFKSV